MVGAEPHRSGACRIAHQSIAAAVLMGGFAVDCAAQTENPQEILAVRVRQQGYVCDRPIKAERDQRASKPMATVWVLQCNNASYRIILHPDMAAQIEVVR